MPTTVRFRSNGKIVTFDQPQRIGTGGEGAVYELLNDPLLVVKIYHPGKATPDRARKLEVMLQNPPADPMRAKGHASIAWPTELLDYVGPTGAGLVNGQVIGFCMPRLARDMSTIVDFYDPKARIRNHPAFTYQYLMRAARNFVSAVRALHSKGYVIGDVNESNIMVDGNSALVTVVDTDSFQVTDSQSGAIYRCTVGKPDFTPPELQGKTFSQVDRNQSHDLFGVAVILFQLLMENAQPFGGRYAGAGDPPEYAERIEKGFFTYSQKRRVPFSPGRLAPPFDMLHPDLRRLFIQCFEDGHTDPTARPDARTWGKALENAERSLICCIANGQHYFGSHLNSCPWCDRAHRIGVDTFPSHNQTRATQQAFTPKPRAASGKAGRQRPAPPLPVPVIHNFYANSASIFTGHNTTLSWHITNALSVTINNGVGTVALKGNATVTLSANTTYTLTAQGAGGTVTRTVRIAVSKPPPILFFNANSSSIHIGQQVTLRWSVTPPYAASINNGIGGVTNAGQLTLTPPKTTNYVLTATDGGHPVKQRIRVVVTLPPLPVALDRYLPLDLPGIALAQYASLNPMKIALKPYVLLTNYSRLTTFDRLQPMTIRLNNYMPLRSPPPAKRSLSTLPFYQRLPIHAFNKVLTLVRSMRKGGSIRTSDKVDRYAPRR